MLKMADLAARPDFKAGSLLVSPSRRSVRGPGGEVHLEPRIMQVFLLLLDASGRVVTRNEIFDQCWGGAMVGDDSLNRAIAGVRRIASEIAPGAFEVETIPRTGYRLIGEILGNDRQGSADEQRAGQISRRTLVAAGAAAAAVGSGIWWAGRSGTDPRSAEIINRGRQLLREAWPESDKQGVEVFQQAVALEPDNAEAWGLLAMALRNLAESAPPGRTSAAVRECQAAAERALALDPREGNALAAQAMLQPEFGEWAATEDRLRKVLKVAPNNIFALGHLVMLLQSVGRAKESWNVNERARALEPLSPVPQYRRGLKLWIFGRVAEADVTIDRALQLWPRHPGVWNARLYIFAFTGRESAALAMIDDIEARPLTFKGESEDRWRVSLRALRTRSATDVAAATEANLKVSGGGLAVAGIMILSALGQVDAAFEVANGWLLRKGPRVARLWPGSGQMRINDQQWRRTMNLFTPATAAMRSDVRFKSLCEGMGMTAYWQQRGVWPDRMFNLA